MLALRYLYVLALAIWLGGMVGELFGTANARFPYVASICGATLVVTLAAMKVLGPRPAAFALRLLLAAAMLMVALYSGFAITAAPFHQLASRLLMTNLAGALVLLYWEARNP